MSIIGRKDSIYIVKFCSFGANFVVLGYLQCGEIVCKGLNKGVCT